MLDYTEDASEETLAARIAYYRKRAAEAEQEAKLTNSPELREAYLGLSRCLSRLAKKNARREYAHTTPKAELDSEFRHRGRDAASSLPRTPENR
jgi:hypothetical protein